jgi:hypothetical protein
MAYTVVKAVGSVLVMFQIYVQLVESTTETKLSTPNIEN